MVWFIGFATEWSATSNFLNHAWITWVTRGLYTGYRRINFNTQVDDMFLVTELYSPAGTEYIIGPTDLAQHIPWMVTINNSLPKGSSYFIEIGHNGNGNIEDAANTTRGERMCGIGPIEYDEQIDTPLEFAKPMGTGINLWPAQPNDYPYTASCTNLDSLKTWWATAANRDAFAHVSHTFTHEDQNNATYSDITREISWNAAWLIQVGFSSGTRFSPKGIIPPAITGLHNGDALRAWKDNGIINVVGDNTRPVLMNTKNEHWPLITTVADNGYAGIQITPRWATNIYYNCAVPDCTVLEWHNTAHGTGTYKDLIDTEKNTNIRHLLALHHDAFMFHQANMNTITVPVPTSTLNGVSGKYSMLQTWVGTMVQELTRLVTWPIISLKHDDLALSFLSRMNRDACKPVLTYSAEPSQKIITSVTLTTTGNICSEKIPITVPGTVTDTKGFVTEQLGTDPLTIWAQMSGSPLTFTLSPPISFYY
ncbi:hypothetical protein HYALB_00004864 [Hymenoscyphus albidus]|uniref:Extracellular serine-rich protein n=1 Tax=Hymenoscyphus albidus TaxID=595503 RepID=A0A9N9M0X9_9HELO|nr:hypothetical protein HYALB_00004864 [Hymenoscyphus albidus]